MSQENQLGYPYPKWHPYYAWGWGTQGYNPNPAGLSPIGDPNIQPPGNWFGRPVVGARQWLRAAHVGGRPLAVVGADAGQGSTVALTAILLPRLKGVFASILWSLDMRSGSPG